MEFGSVLFPEKVNFLMPPTHPATTRFLARQGRPAYLQPRVYIGCPTWANKIWKGKYYPAGVPDKEYLHWYSQQFNTIELNTTFYQIPPPALISKWHDQVGADFMFCPKLPQLITQNWQLPQATALSLEFYRNLQAFQEHLGTSFLQLPTTFSPSKIDELIKYLECLPKDWALALELRQESWFSQPKKLEVLFEVLEALGITSVITDVAGRRDVLHQRLTTNTAFIRFNGYGLIPSDYARIDVWVQRLAEWFNLGLEKLYFFVHQENNLDTPILINYLIHKLNLAGGFNLKKPTQINQVIQGSLFGS